MGSEKVQITLDSIEVDFLKICTSIVFSFLMTLLYGILICIFSPLRLLINASCHKFAS